MKKNQIFLLCFLLLSAGSNLAQQLTPFVVSPSGGFYSNSSGMLSFTTGEMVAVETFTSPSAILTQGFQQAWDFGTYVNEHPDLQFSFDIYPNPTGGVFKLVTESAFNEHVTVRILDVLGREIQQASFNHQDNIHIEYFDLSYAAQAVYFIALSVQENNTSGVEHHFMRKIQLVR